MIESHGNCEPSDKPTQLQLCGHADVFNEAANPDFYVRSLVSEC